MSRSPIYADFSAALEGLTTLRAYQLQTQFNLSFWNQIDTNTTSWFSFLMVSRWLGFRLDLISTILVVCMVFLSAGLKNTIDVGLLGFALVYVLNLSGLLQWYVSKITRSSLCFSFLR